MCVDQETVPEERKISKLEAKKEMMYGGLFQRKGAGVWRGKGPVNLQKEKQGAWMERGYKEGRTEL